MAEFIGGPLDGMEFPMDYDIVEVFHYFNEPLELPKFRKHIYLQTIEGDYVYKGDETNAEEARKMRQKGPEEGRS